MGKYIHYYRNKNNFESDRLLNYVEPWTSFLSDKTQEEVKFNKTEEEKERERKLQTPLTFEITGDGTIYWKAYSTALTKTIQYNLNESGWTSITSNTGSSVPSISVNAGDTIQFRGNNTTYGTSSYYSTFSGSTAQFNVKGNIMSLTNPTNFSILTTLSNSYTFRSLFYNCTGLTDASQLILPATTLANNCYVSMFYGCTSLTTAPELPATTLTDYCYGSMFNDCTSLTTAPELPATTLADNCYQGMFYGCTSLTTAPVLPATTLTWGCYHGMFQGCSSLNYIKCLATDISAYVCTSDWVTDVASSGTFVKAASMTGWTTGTNGIPTGWEVQNDGDGQEQE